mgnify:FL=1
MFREMIFLEDKYRAILNGLMLKYQNDDEALEMISRAEADIKYLCKCQKVNNYKGQTPEQYLNCLEAHLNYWN